MSYHSPVLAGYQFAQAESKSLGEILQPSEIPHWFQEKSPVSLAWHSKPLASDLMSYTPTTSHVPDPSMVYQNAGAGIHHKAYSAHE